MAAKYGISKLISIRGLTNKLSLFNFSGFSSARTAKYCTKTP
jgi:hypothetical protein